MSKITNDGLTRSGCFIAVPIIETVGVKVSVRFPTYQVKL